MHKIVQIACLSLLIGTVLLVPGCQGQNPNCRANGQVCSITTDCCDGLLCSANNTCEMPGSGGGDNKCGNGTCDVGETSQTCCQDCACAAGQSCRNNRCEAQAACGNRICDAGETQTNCCTDCGCSGNAVCQNNICGSTPAVCGNKICEAGESQSNCCTDCGCPSGQSCANNSCSSPIFSTQSWTFINNCFNGEPIQLRIFDRTINTAGAITSINPGGSSSGTFQCRTGDSLCFGARQPIHGFFWGVDIDGLQGCATCCYTCANNSVNVPPLTCR